MEGTQQEREVMLDLVKNRLGSAHLEDEASLVKISEVVDKWKSERGKEFREARDHAKSTAINVAARALRNAAGDVDGAAEQTMRYWNRRKMLFEQTAHRPMTATGTGTLNENDIEVLQSGFIVILPSTRTGEPVVCFDRSRLEDDFDDISRIVESARRCMFYIIDILSEREESRSKGCVLLEVYHSSYVNLPTDDALFGLLDSLLNEIMPITLVRCEVIIKPPRIKRELFMEEVLPNLRATVSQRFQYLNFSVHLSNSRDKLLSILEQKGMSKEGLPVSVGGK